MGQFANRGAFVIEPAFFSDAEVAEASLLAREMSHTKTTVHTGGKYATLDWYKVNLPSDIPFCRKLLARLGVEKPGMLVFYYLEPGAKIHPHRDLTGATLNNRLRFHVPIATNPEVDFRVSGQRVQMQPGELWCLDTSYEHSVHNAGDTSRVHLIVECEISPEIRREIPSGLRAKLHSAAYAGILLKSFVVAILKNSITDPAYFRAQMGMVWRFLGWRFKKG